MSQPSHQQAKQKKIVIIGAGAAGLFCAVNLPCGADITVLDRMDIPGKKLLATGNGRCNLSNELASTGDGAFYHGGRAFAAQVMNACPPAATRALFAQLGLQTVADGASHLIYPASFQALSVQLLLQSICRAKQIKIITNCTVHHILCDKRRVSHPFIVKSDRGDYPADVVVLATGGKSSPALGSDGSGYALARQLGHCVLPQYPALVQLKSSSKLPRRLKGVRVRGKLSIEIDGIRKGEKEGEMLFTDYGLSGICTMELSRIVSRALAEQPGCCITAVLDFAPGWVQASLQDALSAYMQQGLSPEEALIGFLPVKLAHIIAEQAQNDPKRMALIIKNWKLPIVDTLGFAYAQVTCGGVDTAEVNPATLESRLHEGVYFLGELLDVDGDCGGFNLQFAWSCGAIAAKNITEVGMNL